MHKLLARQIKRLLGSEEQQLPELLQELLQLSLQPGLSPAAARLLGGLGSFFDRVDGAYEQSDRDLDLKTRSLELSSTELSGSNDCAANWPAAPGPSNRCAAPRKACCRRPARRCHPCMTTTIWRRCRS
jgi:hypothetical protein